MSVTEEVRALAGPAAVGESQFDRTPPQDVAAEQCVLGGMLLSKDAIADVVEILRLERLLPARPRMSSSHPRPVRPGRAGRPGHCAAALTDAGDIGRVGGAAYLHTWSHAVPTAANAAYYARIVASGRCCGGWSRRAPGSSQLGYGSAAGQGRDVDDIVDLAQQAVYDVTERRVSDDFPILADLLQPGPGRDRGGRRATA